LAKMKQEHEAAFRLRDGACVRVVQDTTKVDGLGGEVWAGALVLCEFLEEHAQEVVQGRDVIELGAGCGLCGLVAASLSANATVLTDEYPDLLARNIAKNCHLWAEREADNVVSSGELEWGVPESIAPFARKFDTMLGSEITHKCTASHFVAAAKQTGFTVRKHPSDDWSVVFELRFEGTF
ncbi:hypothetical protein PHYSODRAFT_523947, partial [Phytophthora sojae]